MSTARIALQKGLGLKDDKGIASDKGTIKFRKVEIRPLTAGTTGTNN